MADKIAREPKYHGALVDTMAVQVKIKQVIVRDLSVGTPEAQTKKAIKKLIDEFCESIDDAGYKERARAALVKSFVKWYREAATVYMALPFLVLAVYKNAPSRVRQEARKQVYRLPPQTVKRIENLTPHAEYGREWHDNDYRRRLKAAYTRYLARFADDEAKYSRRVSLRNLAEVEVRRGEIAEMLSAMRARGVRLAWASSHADCSERCAPWQGKLYSLDGTYGQEDGHPFQPIENAVNVIDKYGNVNGLFGYNCFDDQTEVFTDKGWRLFRDLDGSEKIYTLSPETRETEWQKPLRYFKQWHDGEMIWLHNKRTDIMCTPNHDLLYFTQKDKRLRFKRAAEFSTETDFLLSQNCDSVKEVKKDEVPYRGFIYCLEVPNHTLLVKRNGRIVWCGNCRHRLIPYTPKSRPPRDYTEAQMARERAIDQRQREMEKTVRNWKIRGYVLRKENPEASRKAFEKAREWTDRYEKYSHANGRAFYRERIQVMREEI